MLDIAFVLLVIAALLVVVGLCQPLAAYLRLPPPVLLGVVGVGLGVFPAMMSQLGWPTQTDPFADIFVALPFSSASFIYVFLPLLVFEAGIVTDVRRMLQDAAPILLLAVVAQPIDDRKRQAPGKQPHYHITAEGEAFLAANRADIDALLSRIDAAGTDRPKGAPAPVVRGMENLKLALRLRLRNGPVDQRAAEAIAAALDAAAQTVERS